MTRVSVLGSWRKGRANIERGSGLYLKRSITNSQVHAIVIHEGDGLMEYEGYEYIGPLEIAGPIKTAENTQELAPGQYIYRGAHSSASVLISLGKKVKPEEGDSCIGPIFCYCPMSEEVVVPKPYFYTKFYEKRLYTYELRLKEDTLFQVASPVEDTAKELFKQGVEKFLPKEK